MKKIRNEHNHRADCRLPTAEVEAEIVNREIICSFAEDSFIRLIFLHYFRFSFALLPALSTNRISLLLDITVCEIARPAEHRVFVYLVFIIV